MMSIRLRASSSLLRGAAALTLALLLAASTASAATPPKNLHKVGDHWTAWDPPTTFPEGADVYTIVRGDTLWDLAGRYYENPYLWPQIWELNPYILDAHWIYPGDPLVVSLKVITADELAELEDDTVEEEEAGLGLLNLDRSRRPPQPLGSKSDVFCSGYLGLEQEREFGYSITGSEHEVLFPRVPGLPSGGSGTYGAFDTTRYNLSIGDIVYLDGGRSGGLAAGDEFSIVSPGETVVHPLTDRVAGRVYRRLGRVRVLSVQENAAIGEISQACAPVVVGSMLEPYIAEPVPLGRITELRPASFPSPAEALEEAPVVVHAADSVVSIAADHIVYLDRGEEDNVLPGDIFTIYRTNRPGNPPVVIGELAVLSVQPRTAVAKVLETRYPVYVGDLLELK